jgi:hypothetical protein
VSPVVPTALTADAPAAGGRERGAGAGVGAAALTALLLLFVPFRGFEALDRDWVVWVSGLLLLAIPVLAHVAALRRRDNPWLDPVFLITAFFGSKYGFGIIATNYWSELSWVETPGISSMFQRWGIWDNLPTACHLFALAGLGLYIGVSLRPLALFDALPALRWTIDTRRFRMNLYVYTPVAMTLFVVGRGVLPLVVRDTALLFGWISWVLIIIAASQWLGREETDRSAWLGIVAIIVLGHIALGFEIGMRGAFVYPFLLIGAGYTMVRRRIPWGRVLVATVLLILVVIPWLTFYKIQPPETPFADRVRAASEEMSAVTLRGALERGVEAVVGRSVGVVGMAAVFVQDVPDLGPFEYGRTFLIQAMHVVPRLVWPDKPNMSEQLNMYSRRAGLVSAGDEATTATFDAVSEYYVNFGIVGVFLLSLVHGCYLRVLHRWLVERSAFLIGPPMFLVFILINFDFFGVVQTMLAHSRQIPVWTAVLYLLSRATGGARA